LTCPSFIGIFNHAWILSGIRAGDYLLTSEFSAENVARFARFVLRKRLRKPVSRLNGAKSMKGFIILFIACVLMPGTASAQGWERQNSPTGNYLASVVFVDTCHGWAVGDSGTIIHTTDGGGTWVIQNTGTTLFLLAVDFVDVSNGWAAGYDNSGGWRGVVVHTTDGGGSWTTQSMDTTRFLAGVDFVDANTGWAVGSTFSSYSVIMHTSDGGGSWTPQDGGTYPSVYDAEFVDGNNGWVVGGRIRFPGIPPLQLMLRTTDAGSTWTEQIYTADGPLLAVCFVDQDHGWAVGSDYGGGYFSIIIQTTDGGETWIPRNPGSSAELSGVDFVDENHGWAVGSMSPEGATILRTTDGGAAWTTQTVHSSVTSLKDIRFFDANHGWAVGGGGTILRYNPNLSAPDEYSDLQPSSFSLSTFPNPFNPSTTIAYDLPKAGHISLRVFDLLGREVAVLKDGFVEAGTHRVTFDGSGLASGIYFARLDAEGSSQTKKLVLMR
jgi:photosystem II stability/assembly factor-like uncharacterized protein